MSEIAGNPCIVATKNNELRQYTQKWNDCRKYNSLMIKNDMLYKSATVYPEKIGTNEAKLKSLRWYQNKKPTSFEVGLYIP